MYFELLFWICTRVNVIDLCGPVPTLKPVHAYRNTHLLKNGSTRQNNKDPEPLISASYSWPCSIFGTVSIIPCSHFLSLSFSFCLFFWAKIVQPPLNVYKLISCMIIFSRCCIYNSRHFEALFWSLSWTVVMEKLTQLNFQSSTGTKVELRWVMTLHANSCSLTGISSVALFMRKFRTQNLQIFSHTRLFFFCFLFFQIGFFNT